MDLQDANLENQYNELTESNTLLDAFFIVVLIVLTIPFWLPFLVIEKYHGFFSN